MHLFVWKEKLLLISGRKESLNSQRLGALTVSPFSSALSIFPVTARLGILLCDYWSTSIPPALSAPRPITAVSPAQKCRPTYAQPSVPIYRGLQGNSHLLASFPQCFVSRVLLLLPTSQLPEFRHLPHSWPPSRPQKSDPKFRPPPPYPHRSSVPHEIAYPSTKKHPINNTSCVT
jgi:hypothetical protein